ncbi:MAG TPA: T9SS type A sorting domain-containing protein [Bacteroidetes bacterium]|nr:T9SS type A sorting domain-containing protein [Bacteroidota bacterium]
MGVSENPAPIAVDYSLQQNYPNPFNPETSIRYSLKEQSRVILKIYNLKGETVATLVDGVVSAGLHDVNWNAANMPSGVYLYKLKTAKFSQTKKMLLVK